MFQTDHYWECIAVLFTGRGLDLLSTWYATPRFVLELNQWMKHVGWKKTILINVALVLILPLLIGRHYSIVISVFSALLASRNFQLGAVPRVIGEEQYLQIVSRYYAESSAAAFWVPVAAKLFIFALLATMFIAAGAADRQQRLWLISSVGEGMMLFALFIALVESARRVRAGS